MGALNHDGHVAKGGTGVGKHLEDLMVWHQRPWQFLQLALLHVEVHPQDSATQT